MRSTAFFMSDVARAVDAVEVAAEQYDGPSNIIIRIRFLEAVSKQLQLLIREASSADNQVIAD